MSEDELDNVERIGGPGNPACENASPVVIINVCYLLSWEIFF